MTPAEERRKKKILNPHCTFVGLPFFSQKKTFLHSERFKEFFQKFHMVLRWVLPLKLSDYFSFSLSYFHFYYSTFWLETHTQQDLLFLTNRILRPPCPLPWTDIPRAAEHPGAENSRSEAKPHIIPANYKNIPCIPLQEVMLTYVPWCPVITKNVRENFFINVMIPSHLSLLCPRETWYWWLKKGRK